MTDQEKQEMEAESLGLDPSELEPIESAADVGTFTATTIYGEEVEIVSKRPEGQAIVLVSDQGAEYVSLNDDNGYLRKFEAGIHDTGDGNATEPATGDVMGSSADATEAAEARAELDAQTMEDGVDATDAAEAKAALEADLAQSPVMGGEDGPLPPAAEETPEPKKGKGK